MFSKASSGSSKKEYDSQAYNLIDSRTVISGDIKTEGNIRIDGTLKGSLSAKGKLVVGESGKIEGEVFCANADISGTLKAKIKVTELLSLKATAKLLGDIETGKLAIEPGANFSGSCSMGALIKEMTRESGQEERKETAKIKERTA